MKVSVKVLAPFKVSEELLEVTVIVVDCPGALDSLTPMLKACPSATVSITPLTSMELLVLEEPIWLARFSTKVAKKGNGPSKGFCNFTSGGRSKQPPRRKMSRVKARVFFFMRNS